MRLMLRVVVLAAFAPSVSAQFFVDHPRTMDGDGLAGASRVVIDVDGDGFPDVLTGGTELRYYRNDGAGHFAFVAATPLAPGQALPQAVGDYDGDGKLDYCVGGTLVHNQGNGTFAIAPFSIYTFAVTPSAFLDYDGDGDLDWLVSTGGLRLFANNGTGVFTEVTSTVFAGFDLGVQDFRVVDLDGDGDADVVKIGGGIGPLTVRVWRNQGLGQFTEERLPAPPSMGAFSTVRVAEFDGHGQLDVAVVAPTFAPTGTTYSGWLVSGGTGAWTLTPMNLPISTNELTLADAGDWDGDGRADWVGRTGVYLQTTALQWTFQPFSGVTLAGQPLLVDLDGDGHLDALAHGGTGFVRNRPSGALWSEHPFVAGGASNSQVSQVRRRAAGSPDVEVLTLSGAYLRWGTDAERPGDADRTLRMLSPGYLSGSDAALVAPPTAAGAPGVMLCGGPRFYEVVNDTLVLAPGPVLPAAPTRVAAADLDGQPGDEIVFGSNLFAGPMIAGRTAGGFVDLTPSLPPAPASTAASFEQVLLVDVDGDGDRDIVHEHRWLRNDSGSWSVGASFGALVPASARTLVPLDVDGDGDQDLFVGAAAGASRMLVNTPAGFVDASSAWLPAVPLGAVDRASAGDIDGDGLVDVLCVIAGRSHVLRNGGTAFTWFADVGPAGALADLNHDDRPDLFLGDKVWWNRHTLLWSPGPAVPGSWRLTLETRRSGLPVLLAALLLGDHETFVAMPGIGTLYVDPTSMVSFGLPLTAGAGSLDLTIPSSLAVVGTKLRAQAIAWDGQALQLGNVVRDQVR